MIEVRGRPKGSGRPLTHARGVAHALVLCQTYDMAEMFNFVVHIYYQLVQFVADNTAFVIVVGAIFLALISTDEIRTHRRNHSHR
jgi:hypothetical protein